MFDRKSALIALKTNLDIPLVFIYIQFQILNLKTRFTLSHKIKGFYVIIDCFKIVHNINIRNFNKLFLVTFNECSHIIIKNIKKTISVFGNVLLLDISLIFVHNKWLRLFILLISHLFRIYFVILLRI